MKSAPTSSPANVLQERFSAETLSTSKESSSQKNQADSKLFRILVVLGLSSQNLLGFYIPHPAPRYDRLRNKETPVVHPSAYVPFSGVNITGHDSLLIQSSFYPVHPYHIAQKQRRLFQRKHFSSVVSRKQNWTQKRSNLTILGVICAVTKARWTVTVVNLGTADPIKFRQRFRIASWQLLSKVFIELRM